MTTRELPVDEWSRLQGTELETVWPHLDPTDAHVLVIEDGPQIVGCWAVYRLVHCEGVWIHPDYRKKVSVARRLVLGMFSLARAMGARAVNTAACSHEVRRLLSGLGAVKLDGDHYALNVERTS